MRPCGKILPPTKGEPEEGTHFLPLAKGELDAKILPLTKGEREGVYN